MGLSKIEWTDASWNPVTGCTRVSAGCDLCYAVSITRRKASHSRGGERYQGLVNPGRGHFNGVVKTHPDALEEPRGWRKPRRVFLPSVSDLFHANVSLAFIQRVFEVMVEVDRHAFQVLTKRPERAAELADQLPWPPNVLFGTSVEDGRVLERIDAVRAVPAAVRFLSCEPLIGPLGEIDLSGIHWVIVGGEAGPGARPMRPGWAREIRDQCAAAGVALYFKQWGQHDVDGIRHRSKYDIEPVLDGRTWKQHPAVAGFPSPDVVDHPNAYDHVLPAPMTDEVWERVAPVLPGREGTPGGTGRNNRTFIEAVRWKAYTLRPWRELPAEYGKWNTVAVRVKRWADWGHWDRITEQLGDPYVARLVCS